MLRIATDVRGTFTDLVALRIGPDGRQTITTAKADTTPPEYATGVRDVIGKAGVTMSDIDVFAHGSTVVINALTERKGCVVGLITTAGFRDVLEIARGNRPDFFNLGYVKPPPFVPRRLCRELPGRMSYRGEELAPLDLAPLPAILAAFRSEGVQAIAVCLLHAYANSAHERDVAAAIRDLWPQVGVVASQEITREWREYERTSTTVLCAYVQPIAGAYLTQLQASLTAGGCTGRFYVMQSNGGVDTLSAAARIPVTMVESGPASGMWAAAELGQRIGLPNVLALDIGGTTAKCALIEQGRVRVTTDYWIERSRRSAGYPILVPVVDLVEIGSGGGSIAWVDDFAKLHVGPHSAGALPGPAAYGRGGTQATTTDANLALGRIDPGGFRGGADMAAAGAALDEVAARLGLDRIAAARGIIRIANDNMVNALKLVSVNRGFDPRDFTLVAFGGGGGLHAAALAAELGIRHVVVPRAASVFSAWGMLMSDLRRDFFTTRLLRAAVPDALAAAIAEAEAQAVAAFKQEGIAGDAVKMSVFVRCRYENQEHAVEVPAADLATLRDNFHALYEREYTYRLDAPMEITGLHVIATVALGKLAPEEICPTGATLAQARKPTRAVDYALEGVHRADIYALDRLEPGMRLHGPAVLEDGTTTIVIHPGDTAWLDGYGNTHIAIGPHA